MFWFVWTQSLPQSSSVQDEMLDRSRERTKDRPAVHLHQPGSHHPMNGTALITNTMTPSQWRPNEHRPAISERLGDTWEQLYYR